MPKAESAKSTRKSHARQLEEQSAQIERAVQIVRLFVESHDSPACDALDGALFILGSASESIDAVAAALQGVRHG